MLCKVTHCTGRVSANIFLATCSLRVVMAKAFRWNIRERVCKLVPENHAINNPHWMQSQNLSCLGVYLEVLVCTQLWCQDFSSPEHCWLFEGAVLSIRYLVLCILGMLLSLGCMKREKAVVCWIVLLTGLQRQWKCLLQREASSSFSFSLGTMMQVLGEWIVWMCIGAVITRSEVVLFNVKGYSYSLSIVAWLCQ